VSSSGQNSHRVSSSSRVKFLVSRRAQTLNVAFAQGVKVRGAYLIVNLAIPQYIKRGNLDGTFGLRNGVFV